METSTTFIDSQNETNRQIKLTLGTCFILVSVLASVLLCFYAAPPCYHMLFILPVAYCICFSLLLFPTVKRHRSLTVTIFSFCSYLRYVILPVLLCIRPYYGFSQYGTQDTDLLTKAIFLMEYELIFISIFIWMKFHLKIKGKHPKKSAAENDLPSIKVPAEENKYGMLIIFVVLSALVFLLVPAASQKLSFGALEANVDTRLGSYKVSTLINILQQVVLVGILTLFVIVCIYCYRKYSKSRRLRYVIISCICACIVTMVIVGEQRSGQVYSAFACIMLLRHCFPEYKTKITNVIVVVAVIVMLVMTIYKAFYAFTYSNYSETLANETVDGAMIARISETYLLGPQTVAAAIEMGMSSSVDFLSLLPFDIARSIIGISFFVSNLDLSMTSIHYNLFVTNNVASNGYLLPITAQGYLCFGFILAPLLICALYSIAFKIEKLFKGTEDLYIKFFAAYIYIRIATCIVSSNLNSVLTASSLILISAGVVFLAQRLLRI